LLSFGLITDLQYADVDDRWDFMKIAERHYRNSLNLLKNAVAEWKKEAEIKFIVQLGDLIDGLNHKNNYSDEALKLVLDQFQDYKVYHLVGNHELYNYNRNDLKNKLSSGYYDFLPHPKWRFVVLDGYEICTIQKETEESAYQYLSQYNPNDLRKPGVDWSCGLTGLNQRFMPYNGGVSEEQLKWFDQILDESIKAGQNVIVLSHLPIAPGSCSSLCLLWNYDKVLDIIYSKGNVVKAVLAGHDHPGGFIRDSKGIYHKTFEAVLEAPIGSEAHCTIQLYEDKIIIKGNGIIPSDTWLFT